jgi:uncharacterized Ntn-hydrolase superfamily protein
MTFSIVGRCPDTGMFGVAVSSSSPAVGSRCASAVSGVGAALTQNFTDPTLGRRMLELMALGARAPEAVDIVGRGAADPEYRQLAAIGVIGEPGVFTGALCLKSTGMARSAHAAAIGNLLSNSDSPARMVEAFEGARGHLASRLLCALKAGLESGGEIEDVRSAGLMVVERTAWPVVDLRIDWTDGACPIAALHDLWAVWEPRMGLYMARAVSPATAPETDSI